MMQAARTARSSLPALCKAGWYMPCSAAMLVSPLIVWNPPPHARSSPMSTRSVRSASRPTSHLGQVIQHRTSNNAATDDDNAGMGFHDSTLSEDVAEPCGRACGQVAGSRHFASGMSGAACAAQGRAPSPRPAPARRRLRRPAIAASGPTTRAGPPSSESDLGQPLNDPAGFEVAKIRPPTLAESPGFRETSLGSLPWGTGWHNATHLLPFPDGSQLD